MSYVLVGILISAAVLLTLHLAGVIKVARAADDFSLKVMAERSGEIKATVYACGTKWTLLWDRDDGFSSWPRRLSTAHRKLTEDACKRLADEVDQSSAAFDDALEHMIESRLREERERIELAGSPLVEVQLAGESHTMRLSTVPSVGDRMEMEDPKRILDVVDVTWRADGVGAAMIARPVVTLR